MTNQTETSILDDLFAFLDQEEAQELELDSFDHEQEGFMIRSMEQANYFARKLNEVRAEKEAVHEAAKMQLEAYKERINKWLVSTTSPLINQEARLLSLLENFAKEKLEGSSKKSLKLIEGTLQFKKQTPKFEYEEKTLLAYVETQLSAYKKTVTSSSVDKVALKKDVEIKGGLAYIDGKEVQGITVQELPDSFDLK